MVYVWYDEDHGLPPARTQAGLEESRRSQRRCSEAELLREAVSRLTGEAEAPVPKLPLFRATGPSIAEQIDGALEGFGVR